MRPRTIGRRLALQYMFMADLHRYEAVESPSQFFAMQRDAVRDASPAADGDEFRFDEPDPHRDEAEEFALELICAVQGRREEIDADIERAAKNWTLSRMGAIERNVIRIAAAEMDLGATPASVVMDEAVELAKRFGDKDSGAFVNGIVDRLGGGRGAAPRG